MSKQTKKAAANKGRKKVQVNDLSKTEENLSAKHLKKVRGGMSDIQVSKVTDASSQNLFRESLMGEGKKVKID
jgi:hypothetical protein